MNVIGSLGVLLTGDSSSLVQATQVGQKALAGMQQQVSTVSRQMPLLQAGFHAALGVAAVSSIAAAVRAWMPLEEKIAGLSQIVDDSGVVDQIKEIAKTMQDFAGIDSTQTFRMAESIKMMGVENKDLAKTLSLVQGIQIASNGMVGERQGLRMLQMYQSGNTKMFERYISDLGKATTAEQKQALIQDWLTTGLKRKGAEMDSTAGQIKRYRSAQADLVESMGEMYVRVLQLDKVFGVLAAGMRSIRDSFDNASTSTKGWIVAAVVTVGVVLPLVTVFSSLLPVLKAIGVSILTVGTSLMAVMLPAVVAVSAAFLGWNLGTTLSNLKIGGTTIGQYMKELSMTILKGWDWLWDILPQKVAIAFTKINTKIADFIGIGGASMREKLKTQEAALSQSEARREEQWKMNEKWLKDQDVASKKDAFSWNEFGKFSDQFSKNAGDLLFKIIEEAKAAGNKISTGDLMKSFLNLFPKTQQGIPNTPEMPAIGQPASSTAPQYAAALERGTVGAYSVQMQQVQRLSKIQSASEDTADNTETTNTLLEEFLLSMPQPVSL